MPISHSIVLAYILLVLYIMQCYNKVLHVLQLYFAILALSSPITVFNFHIKYNLLLYVQYNTCTIIFNIKFKPLVKII